MRKSFILAVLLAGFSLGVLLVGTWYINQGRDKVEISEHILFGDLTEAEGISFQVHSQWDHKLVWHTEYQIGNQPQTKSVFQFYPKGVMDSFDVAETEIAFYLPAGFGATGNDLLRLNEWELPYVRLFQEVADRTGAGEERTEEFYLADYYPYYPLRFEVQSSKISSMIVPEDAQKRINQYFQIPVLPDHKVEISIQKDGNDEVVQLKCNNLEGGMDVRTSGIVLDNGCYFAIACYNSEEQLLDRELSGMESGIYFLPYHWEEGERLSGEPYAVMEYENITCVYPLEAEQEAVVVLQEEGDRFLLVTKEEDQLVLTVIEKETYQTLQRMEIFAWEEEELFQSLEQGEEGILISMNNGRFCFLAKDEMGFYQDRIYGDFNRIEDVWERRSLIMEHSFAWDGERLVIAGFQYQWSYNSVYLAVFRKTGMVFLGFYSHSGDLDMRLGMGGGYASIRPMEKVGLLVQ